MRVSAGRWWSRRRGSVSARWVTAAALAALAAAGCRREGAPPSSQARPSQARLTPQPARWPGVFDLAGETYTPTTATLRLRLPAGAPRPANAPTLVFCLPADRAVRLHAAEVRIGGRPVALRDWPGGSEESATPFLLGRVEFAGYLRRWPLYRWMIPASILDAFRQAAADGDRFRQDFELDLTFTWDEPVVMTSEANQGGRGEQAWRELAGHLVANPGGLARFAVSRPPLPRDLVLRLTDPRPLAPGATRWLRLEIDRDGPVRLDRDALVLAGVPAGDARPESVRVFAGGEPVPLLRAGERGAPDDPPGSVYFWARGGQGPYSTRRTYWIALDASTPPSGLAEAAAPPDATPPRPAPTVRRTAVFEQDNTLQKRTGSFLAIQGMTWVQEELLPGRPLDVPLRLPDLAPTAGPIAVTLDFFISGDVLPAPAQVSVRSGASELARVTVQHHFDASRSFTLPASALRDGAATLTLSVETPPTPGLPPAGDEEPAQLWFDKATVVYDALPRLVDGVLALTGDGESTGTRWTELDVPATQAARLTALRVERSSGRMERLPLEGRPDGRVGLRWAPDPDADLYVVDFAQARPAPRLLAASFDDLADDPRGVDLLIVTHPEFREAADRLAAFHRGRGLRVRTVSIQAVYDLFNDGDFSPLALRAMLGWMMARWHGDAPAWVLLVGDCSSDYLGLARNEVRNWVPTYTFPTSSDQWASDHWLTMIAGDDDLGDYLIGRLSVSNRADAEAVVDKIVAYGSRPRPGPWRARVGFVSDDGEFPEVVDALRREMTPPAFAARRVFLNELPMEDNWYLDPDLVAGKQLKVSRAATQAILDTFREGVAYLTYYGHGSPNIWADERIWFGGDSVNSDNRHLAGSGTMSFVANMTCNSGAIDYPVPPWNICITEDLMRVRDGGAIACYVPSGPGVTSMHRRMSDALHQALFADGARNLGAVAALAKARYLLQRNPRELALMYLLLGDPALDLQLSPWRTVELPQPAVAPGSGLRIPLGGLTPASGRWTAELQTESGRTLWRAEGGEYRNGQLDVEVPVPAEAPGGPAQLQVYCWDEASGADLAIGAAIRIQRPAIEIAALHADGPTTRALPAVAVRAELRNPTGVAARGDWEWIRWDGLTSRSLGREAVQLGPDQSTTLRLPLAIDAPTEPVVIEGRLTLPTAPDAPDAPLVASRQVAVAYPPRWIGPVLAMGRIERRPALRSVRIAVPIATTLDVRRVEGALVTATGETLLRRPLFLEPAPTHRSAQFDVSLASDLYAGLARGGRLRLTALPEEIEIEAPATTATLLAEAPLETLAVVEPRLRIVPDSIRTRPERPTDGETIFVDGTVENAGTLDADPAMIGLFDRPQQEGGRRLPSLQSPAWVQTPRLAPGRRVPVTLRWDPFRNAGLQRVCVQIANEQGGAEPNDPDTTQWVSVPVLTKWDLKLTSVTITASEEDRAANRLNIHATLVNRGQTDARGVVVTFYRGRVHNDANRLGEVELDRVRGESTVTATFVWNYDPVRDGLVRGQRYEFSASARLKGSTNRILSDNAQQPGAAQ